MAFHPGETEMSDVSPLRPTIGRIVHYRLSQYDCQRIEFNRSKYGLLGNPVAAGDVVPVLVTKVWSSDLINGKAQIDGEGSFWVTSAARGVGDEPGTWFWPPRV